MTDLQAWLVLGVKGVARAEVDEADADLVAGLAGDADEGVAQRDLLVEQGEGAALVAADHAEGALVAEDRQVHVGGDLAVLAGRDAEQAVAGEGLEDRASSWKTALKVTAKLAFGAAAS
jgi:hypothetical protein